MLKRFKALLDDLGGTADEAAPGADALPLALAALMFEISRADHDISDVERQTIAEAVARVSDVPAASIDELLSNADAAVEESVSVYEFTNTVNEHLGHERKYELLLMLWRVAWADGEIDRYEDYYVRKICDLLHLSQRDFIRAKHAAAPPA